MPMVPIKTAPPIAIVPISIMPFIIILGIFGWRICLRGCILRGIEHHGMRFGFLTTGAPKGDARILSTVIALPITPPCTLPISGFWGLTFGAVNFLTKEINSFTDKMV